MQHRARTFGLASVLAACLTLWTAGEPGAADESAASSPSVAEAPITPSDRRHWSFRPLERPEPPAVRDASWPRTPIDRFVLHRIEEAGLAPLPPAGRLTLIRRVTFDLTGLPPTPEEIGEFLADASPLAYEKLVDRLLASPAYGERWAQHWLDLARFAETDGFEHDHVRENAWQYRDWVIDALNADVPYDEFVQLQLAGDELRPADPAARIATGFLLCGPDMPDINLQDERAHAFLNDMTGAVGSVLLGLQVGCAACHDHKYDPVSQLDFYRLRAFFDPAVQFEKNKSVSALKPVQNPPPSRLMIRGDFRRPGPEVVPAFLRIANPWKDEAPAAFPAESAEPTEPAADDNAAGGPRSALARWITRPDHPLATRVIVNRIWQHHFGRGICYSPSDFGIMGDWPTHPDLLDWLAAELPRRGWSLKQLHRLIVTSAVYRQAARPEDSTWTEQERQAAAHSWKTSRAADPNNEWLARMPRRRLEGEAVRDAMLAASGGLNRRAGGPGVRPPLPSELVSTLLRNQWNVTGDEREHRRRSIYVFVRRNLNYPLFDVFDKPDTNQSCAQRNRSTIAPQSLMLLNSEFSLSAARALAGTLLGEAGSDRSALVERCYLRTLGRPPTADERRLAQEFLSETAERLRKEGRSSELLAVPQPLPEQADLYEAAALTDLCLAVFNLNEFIYID